MKKTLKRIFSLALLTMVSMGAWAQIDVQIVNDGQFDGGTIEVTGQKDLDDGVEVTITVAPNKGYTIKKGDISVFSTIPPSGSSAGTRNPDIAEALTLYYNGSEKEDIKDDSSKRDYTFIVPSGFGAWVKEVMFTYKDDSGSKGNRDVTDYSGIYYIGSRDYAENNTTNNYYLCPTENWNYYTSTSPFYTSTDNGQPFMTTYQCRNGSNGYETKNAVWIVENQFNGYYHIKRAIDGKYLTYNAKMASGSEGRMRLHLEDTADGDNALFQVNYVSGTGAATIYEIITKNVVNNYKYLNITGASGGKTGNQPSLQATNVRSDGPGNMNIGGILGLWTSGGAGDNNSKWYLERATVDPPTITNNYAATNTFTITSEMGATIYYTTDGTTPTTSTTTTGTTSVSFDQTESMTVIKAIAKGASDDFPSLVATYELPKCDKPVITISGGYVTITCATEGAIIHYTTDGTPATSSSATYTTPFVKGNATTFRAIATNFGYVNSNEATFLPPAEVSSSSQITDMSGNYILADNFTLSGSIGTSDNPFTGTIDGNMVTRANLGAPLVAYADGATIKNVILKDINIDGGTNVGAICNEARGASRIYNCGVLGTLTETKDANGKVTNITSTSTISGTGYVGSIVGLLDGTSRVINCYSFATVSGGTMAAGIVGNNNQTSTQSDLKTIVVNCMFYGDIKGGTSKYPVYGGNSINNDANNGINPYCYFRKNVTFTPTAYNRSWPAEEKNLTRFEYYRSVLNSNRKLCTWWVNGTNETAPTDDDVSEVGIAKWVLDPSIAPYPVLKTWGKYPSIINLDPTRVWDPRTEDADGNPVTPHWVDRNSANTWEGKSYNTLSVSINAGSHGSGSISKNITITDMDTLNCDYGYYKIQLPYYNEVFGNPNGATHAAKYAGNYTDYVVTGWEISGGSNAVDYNFADRNSYSGRIFAQGGYFYVPDGVESITITAHWGKAVYLANRGFSIDRVNVTAGGYRSANRTEANNFAPAGTVPNTFQGYTIYDDLQTAISNLGSSSDYPTVYDQAIVLIGNHQVKNGNNVVDNSLGGWHPFTIMSADFDFDNEPDYCLQFQFRTDTSRPPIQPIRFDFLPVIELGLAVRHNNLAYAIGIMVPQGHFEITETALMRTTQFEWDANVTRYETESPVILNGGEFEQLAVRHVVGNRTSYFLLGGHLWFHRFAPGSHPIDGALGNPRLCPVNVIGGDFPEFYLSGLYRPDKTAPSDQGNPKCYIDGGHFGTIHGAGYDKIDGSVTFKINHAAIGEFYGGGINGSNPIGGNIDVTIDNSRVDKYCGGPEVGDMTGQTVTTHAAGTTFGVFYGGGNGGNSYYRQLQKDGDFASSHIGTWTDQNFNWNVFNPLGVKDDDVNKENKGYHAEYEFEVFNQSNGVSDQITQRGFIRWIQFGITKTGNVVNTLNNCIIENSFYGGGNLATVDGTVTSTLTNTTVKGNVFGAGYSAAIPTFRVHDKSTASFPSITAGVITDGHIDYDSKVYEWTNDPDVESHDAAYMKDHPTYQKDGKWYCYTWNPLENLGKVMGDATLNIDGSTTVFGNVYGGGEESDVAGNTLVNMNGGTIGNGSSGDSEHGNVFGGGKGVADSFKCLKAMVGVENTNNGNTDISTEETNKGTKVIIGNGTVNGTVYGGGEVGRVEWNTVVKIGLPSGTSKPEIKGSVFGAGKGVEQYGYAALVRGNTFVTIQGDAKVGYNVYGGGEIASVGKYSIASAEYAASNPEIEEGMPYSLANSKSGFCNVTVRGNAMIGPDNMKMYNPETGKPDDSGHVFGAGKGILPYENIDGFKCKLTGEAHAGKKHPGRMAPGDVWECYEGDEDAYLLFIETQALATQTNVIIGGNAFVKGSVYGGSENGHLQHDTHVTIEGDCQIGAGFDKSTNKSLPKYSNWPTETQNITESWAECAHWDYDGNDGAPYDPYAIYKKTVDGKDRYYYDEACTEANYAEGGANIGKDGHTYYGNVFGGGSGIVPYAPGKWHRAAGSVGGNTVVDITGGHILTSVYGGNEQTDVGTYKKDANGKITTTPADEDVEKGTPGGKCTINMTGGTVGVPRTKADMQAHPVTCYVYGAGKGDQRIFFNTWTNVINTEVNISGTARIYGSTFGGGEDGHVIEDAKTNIGGDVIIGTTGTSSVDGNIFGGGRGFSATALTAGVVGGNVDVNISGGTILGTVFGGGRLASVGTYFANAESDNYGKMQADTDTDTHGHITINISGGSIGATNNSGELAASEASIGDVYGGCKGTLDDSNFGISKTTTVEISGSATINNSVYGGGEAGNVQGNVSVTLKGGTVVGDFYGGGALAHTNIADQITDPNDVNYVPLTAQEKTTQVVLKGGTVGGNVYGGGLGRMEIKAQAAVDPVGEPGQEGYIPGKPAVEYVAGIAAKVCGDVTVKLNENNVATETVPADNCIVKGSIFGCNNLNGTPLGNVMVHVYKTEDWTGHAKTPTASLSDPDDSHHSYNVSAVYGGGNLAAYEPTKASGSDADKESIYAHVIIEGCGLTSIRKVYGGGNAASTPSTKVEILETYEIEEVFGGGNGKDDISKDGGKTMITNPGANVGFRDYWDYENECDLEDYDTKDERLTNVTFLSDYVYGSGKANVDIKGGTIHRVFGGSNTKGNVRQTAVTMLAEESGCPFCVDEAYGGGKSAQMDAEAKLLMACIPGLKAAYGGAEAADIMGDVTLNITNGTFDRVFGGNNISGTIRGAITVNIEETGCKPIIIGELYGGGNLAGYSIYGYKEVTEGGKTVWKPRVSATDSGTGPETPYKDPEVNVKSFTSIGDIYGGGYGESAVMVGDPTVNINEIVGTPDTYPTSGDFDETGYKEKELTIDIDTENEHTVIIPAHVKGKIGAINNVFGGGNAAKVIGNTHVNIGNLQEVEFVTLDKVEGNYQKKPVVGADIRGNVYGGGNKAEVTGNTNVNIGKSTE